MPLFAIVVEFYFPLLLDLEMKVTAAPVKARQTEIQMLETLEAECQYLH